MTEIQALIFTFIDRHKAVIKAFDEGKLDRYIASLCKTYYGCACREFHFTSTPKGIEIGFESEKEHKLTQKEMCSLITELLQAA